MHGQTVKTLIRLLPKEQSDQGLHCIPILKRLLDARIGRVNNRNG